MAAHVSGDPPEFTGFNEDTIDTHELRRVAELLTQSEEHNDNNNRIDKYE